MARPSTTTVRDLRKNNRSRALWQVFLNGPLTRQEVGTVAGLSPATVSNLVAALVAEGVVVEVGLEDSNGGRPRGLLQVNPGYGYVIGVDVGETAFLVELFDFGLNLRARHASVTDMTVLDPEDAVSHIVEGIEAVIAEAAVEPGSILGVGVAVPGLVEHRGDAVVHGQSVGWHAVPLEAMLRDRTGLPILVDNGAKTLGQAERWFGAARGTDNAVIVLLGIGVGTCIVSNGQVYRGATSSAGEWGHTRVMVGGRTCRCGSAGCLEAYVGAEAILERYGQRAPGEDEESALAALIDAAGTYAFAAEIMDETAVYLGAGIPTLINLFTPERIVLGGWAGLLLGEWLPAIRDAARSRSLRQPFAAASIVLGQLGPEAVTLGAATLPMERFLDGIPVRAATARPAVRRSAPASDRG